MIVLVDDSFARLRELPDCTYDVIITDPPYSEHVHANMTSGTAMKRMVNGQTKRGGIPKVESTFAPLTGFEFAQDLVRVSRRWALSFCAVEDFGAYRDAVGAKQYLRGGIWLKPNAMGQLTGDRPAAAYEGIAIMHRKVKKQWNGRGSYGYWICNGTRGEKGRHPNQKPLKLCLELVAKFSNRGETVFDPFAGSGRIGQACKMLGRNYVGWDNDKAWVEEGNRRIEAITETRSDEECMTLCRLERKAA